MTMADPTLVDHVRTMPFFGRIELRQVPVDEVETRVVEAIKAKIAKAAQLQNRHRAIHEQNRKNIAAINAETARRQLMAQAMAPKTPSPPIHQPM